MGPPMLVVVPENPILGVPKSKIVNNFLTTPNEAKWMVPTPGAFVVPDPNIPLPRVAAVALYVR